MSLIMANKLSQNAILNNWDAVNNFLSLADIDVDNGHIKLFKARCIYTNLASGKITKCRKVGMRYGDNAYGSLALVIPALQDKDGCFCEFSTDYCKFSYNNGELTISGTDSFNTGKGDYTLTVQL